MDFILKLGGTLVTSLLVPVPSSVTVLEIRPGASKEHAVCSLMSDLGADVTFNSLRSVFRRPWLHEVFVPTLRSEATVLLVLVAA